MHGLVGTVRQLLLYTLWADRICLKTLEQVQQDDLVRDAGTSFGSLLGTLHHMLQAQRTWLARFEGKAAPADHAEPAGWAGLAAAWEEASAELGFFLAALTAEQVEAAITWTDREGATHTRPLWQPVLHLVNHSTYHRGQAMSLLRQLGYTPPATDLIVFLLEQAPPPAPPPPPLQ